MGEANRRAFAVLDAETKAPGAEAEDALADGLVTGDERERLCARLTEVEREAESLRQILDVRAIRVAGVGR